MKRTILFSAFIALVFQLFSQTYQPTWESIDNRPVPEWFSNAKFGIFIHWGVYSVPAYRTPTEDGDWHGIYAEWYGPDVMYKPWRNDSFHVRNYGPDFEYRDFAGLFRAELWEPDKWAGLLKNSGAKYVVLTTKHSDGYCLWPTKDPVSKNWNTGDTGPKRDLVGDLTDEVKKAGLKMGFYYSWLEYESIKTTWPHQEKYANERTGYYVPKEVFEKYAIPHEKYIEHCHFQFKELINNYSPDLIWGDATWDHDAEWWQSKEILAWMLNNAPNKENLVINDRWGNGSEVHGGYVTTEYGTGSEKLKSGKPWEECQGIGYSFGYNRAENLEQCKSSEELIFLLIRTVANGGNLLLNIGPRADGTIPVIMQERLLQIGNWLDLNGEAIYGTKPFSNNVDLNEINPNLVETMFLTTTKEAIYLHCTEYPAIDIVLNHFPIGKDIEVQLLGIQKTIRYEIKGKKLIIKSPVLTPDDASEAYVFKIAVK